MSFGNTTNTFRTPALWAEARLGWGARVAPRWAHMERCVGGSPRQTEEHRVPDPLAEERWTHVRIDGRAEEARGVSWLWLGPWFYKETPWSKVLGSAGQGPPQRRPN